MYITRNKMNSIKSIRTLIIDYLKLTAKRNELEIVLRMSDVEKDILQQVYSAVFNLTADPTQSPESLIHLLDKCTSGLDVWDHGLFRKKYILTLIAFAGVEGLAKRRPGEINGPWETLVWIFVKYSAFANTNFGNKLTSFKKPNKATVEYIIQLGSPELCPNPCLRIELFRFIRSFNCSDLFKMYYNCECYSVKVINTLIELSDNNTLLTVEQLPNFSAIDLELIIKDNDIMEYILNESELEKKKLEIIFAVLKITRNFALIEKEKHKQRSRGDAIGYWNRDICLVKQLVACSNLCGIYPQGGTDYKANNNYLVEVIQNNSFLLNYLVETIETITEVSKCVSRVETLLFSICRNRHRLLRTLFKCYIKNHHKYKNYQEINGGVTPAVEYRLRYFQNNSHYHNYEEEFYSKLNDSDYEYN